MDCLILKNRGQGVISHLTKALDEAVFGKALWFRPSEGSVGLDEIIASRISENPSEPIHLAIDLDHEDLNSWDMALLSIITSRAVGGQQLPSGSSIIVASNSPVDQLQDNLSVATLARLVVVDLQSQTPEKFVANHAEKINEIVKIVADSSFDRATNRKSGIIKENNPGAVDLKRAEKPSPDDLSAYPKG
jgi:hypothetical protein